MTTLRCLVIDDEPLAQKGMAEYIAGIGFLELAAMCSNAAQAYAYLMSEAVDLLLLDIEMPGQSGIDFVKSLPYHPAVIFTTAYAGYAVQGYELDVIDYLLKPIPFERFAKAAHKAKDVLTGNDASALTGVRKYCFVKANGRLEKIDYSDILMVEALQNYIAIHLSGKKLVSYMTLSNMEKQLPAHLFVRIHKSFIVSLSKIHTIEGNKVVVAGKSLPLSRTAKDKLMQAVHPSLIRR